MTITEEKRSYMNFKDLLQPALEFISLYEEVIEELTRKTERHNIDVYYDKKNKKLIIRIINNREVVYCNDLECTETIARYTANKICSNFVSTHRISLPSFTSLGNGIQQFKVQNTYFDLLTTLNQKNKKRIDQIHLLALDKMNKFNSDPTNFETKVLEINQRTEEEQKEQFINLFGKILLDRSRKQDQHDIYIYYDQIQQILVVTLMNNSDIIYNNEFKGTYEQTSKMADAICENFIAEHKITLPSINEHTSTLTIQNTYFTIKRKFNEDEMEKMQQLRETAHIKREMGYNDSSVFEEKRKRLA